VLSVGFSGDFPGSPAGQGARGLWVDWGRDDLPTGFHRVDPEQILSGEARL
jgi:hypothetical protein